MKFFFVHVCRKPISELESVNKTLRRYENLVNLSLSKKFRLTEVLLETFNSLAIYFEAFRDYLAINDPFLPPPPPPAPITINFPK